MTVEDPIEFLHRDHQSIVNQREVSVDTRSFAHALRSALRQDPDVILVGEMRDFETVETALLAAETGHLVFSTLHTLDATETINRIIAVFPPHQQKQVRLQLATVLQGGHLAAPHAAGRRPRARAGRRGAGHDALHPRLHRRQGEDAPDPDGHRRGHVAVRDADVRPVDLRPLQQGFVTLDEALRWASNVDEFKLKVQGIATTADVARTRWRAASSAATSRPPRSRGSAGSDACAARADADPGRPRGRPEGGLRRSPCACSPAASCRAAGSASASARAGSRTTVDAAIVDRLTRAGVLDDRRAAAGAAHGRSRPSGGGGGSACARELERAGRRTKDRRARRSPSPSWPRPTSGRSSRARARRSCAAGASMPRRRRPTARLYAALLRQGFAGRPSSARPEAATGGAPERSGRVARPQD